MNNGHTHRHEKNTGGIRRILITTADNIKTGCCDPDTGAYRSLSLHNPESIAEYPFAENAAAYREETDVRDGIPSVVHSLEFDTDKIDQASDRLIRQLTTHSYTGLVAVITTNNHVRLVVGYSEEHLAERPLRLEKITARAGKKHTETGHETVCLTSRDTAKARILDGNIG